MRMKLDRIKNKFLAMACSGYVILAQLLVPVHAEGDISDVIQEAWQSAETQIKEVVNNVVFPVIDLVLAVFFFVKLGTAYFDYRKQGQFEWAAPAILFACLCFTLTAPNFIWNILYMFIFDFVVDEILEGIMKWLLQIILDALSEFFGMIGNMGAELFDETWVQAIVLFFQYFGWVMFAVGFVVAIFECAIESQNGRGSIKDTALNIIKGFMAVSLISTVPIELYKFCISLQTELTTGMSLLVGNGVGDMAATGIFVIVERSMGVLITLCMIIMMGYSVIKIFFANLKRGGILLIQIAVGSLYMFSVPRGYTDGFIQWCKQTIAFCFTAFLQAVVLIAGLGVLSNNLLLGLGLILSATEIPRIAQQFGLETSTKANLMSSVYAMQSAVTITKTITNAVR